MEPRDQDKIAGRWLDVALKQYGEAEPRTGLEGRVLASLHAARERAPERRDWWPALAAFTAIVLIGTTIFWVPGHDSARRRIVARQGVPSITNANDSLDSGRPHSSHTIAVAIAPLRQTARSLRAAERAAEPRLEQFPAPRPLSEQERILASYVAQFPDQAVLVAKAQVEVQKQDESEMQRNSSEIAGTHTSE